MPTVFGTVVAVQEGRFQLALDSGSRRLFILAHDAAVEPEQLTSLSGSSSDSPLPTAKATV